MALRPRIYYNAEQKDQMWDRWQKSESLNAIGRVFDRPSSSIFNQLSPSGGIRPPPRRRAKVSLTLSEREEISRSIVCDLSVRAIASQLGRSPSTVSREINRNGGLKRYRASQADQAAWIALDLVRHFKIEGQILKIYTDEFFLDSQGEDIVVFVEWERL